MLTAFLTAHADFFFWTGVIISTIGGLWFLFDSYRCDVSLARWTLLFPPIALFLVVRYPEECLRSFLVCVVGSVLLGIGMAYGPHSGVNLDSIMQQVPN
jgi:glucose uptake protein GlcU